MLGTYHVNGAAILNARQLGTADAANQLTISAVTTQFRVLHKMWISHDANGATDFDNLNSHVLITIAFGANTLWLIHLHPGNGGTSSLEFEAGPWEFDFSPGLNAGVKNEALSVTVGAFGTGIASSINYLYQ